MLQTTWRAIVNINNTFKFRLLSTENYINRNLYAAPPKRIIESRRFIEMYHSENCVAFAAKKKIFERRRFISTEEGEERRGKEEGGRKCKERKIGKNTVYF